MTSLATFLLAITGSIAARVLTSLGIAIFSYTALTTFANSLVGLIQSQYNSIGNQFSGNVLQILNLGGLGQSLGILTAALVARASLSAIKTLRPK